MDTRCARCTRIFYRRSNRQRFCTPNCRFAANARTVTKPTAGLGPRSCSSCTRLFVPTRGHHMYCSENCRHAAKRPIAAERYGADHRQLRAQLKPSVDAGMATCARCGLPIEPGEAWDLGHVDGGGPGDYSGPEHAACNRATAGRNAEPEPPRFSRVW